MRFFWGEIINVLKCKLLFVFKYYIYGVVGFDYNFFWFKRCFVIELTIANNLKTLVILVNYFKGCNSFFKGKK